MAADLKVWITADSSKLVKGAAEATKSIESYKNSIQKLRAANKDSSSEESKYISRLKMEAQAVHNSATTREEYVTWTKKLKTQLAYINSMYGKNNSLYQEVYNQLQLNVKALNELDAEQKAAAQSAALLAEKEKAIKELKSYNNDISFKNLTGNSIGAAETELKKYEYMLKTLIKTQGSNSDAAKKMSQVYLDQKDTVAQLKEEQSQYSEKVEDSAKKNESWGTKFTSILKNVILFRTVMMATTKIVNAFKNAISDSVKIAAEAEQIYSKLNTVFDGLSNSASSATTVLSRELGVATSTAANAISTVGDYLQAQGMGAAESLELATEWVSKFKDIMAFKDIDMTLEEFAQSFMSGAAGNLRNFRTFGSIVKESAVNAAIAAKNLGDLTDEQESLEKMVTRGTLALEQQTNAWGATKREWDTMLSVSNRLTESFKQWKENIGDALNKGLKPTKEWLTKILDTQNKVSAFYKAFYGNNSTVTIKLEGSTEDIEKSTVDALEKTLNNVFGSDKWWNQIISYLASGTAQIARLMTSRFSSNAESYYTQVNDIAENQLENKGKINASDFSKFALIAKEQFGATFQQVVDIAKNAGYEISDVIFSEAEELYNREMERIANIEAQEKKLVTLAEKAAEIKGYNDNVVTTIGDASSVLDWMNGKNFADTTSAEYLLGMNSGSAFENVNTAINSFISLLEILNGNLSNAMVDYLSFKSQYEDVTATLNANGIQSGSRWIQNANSTLSGEEFNNLVIMQTEIMDMWSDVSEMAKGWESSKADLIGGLKKLYSYESVSAGKNSMISEASTYALNESRLGMDARQTAEAELKALYDSAISTATAMGATEDQLKGITKEYEKSGKALTSYYDALDKNNKELERANTLKGYSDSTTNYRTQADQLGMTADEITKANLVSEALKAFTSGDMELYNKINGTIMAFDDLQKKTKEQADAEALAATWQNLGRSALAATGTVGNAVNTFTDGEGNIWTDILTVLLDIFQQSEYWSDVVDLFDQLIQPILPLVEMIVYTLQSLAPVFEILTFVVKVIASFIAAILKVVNHIIDIVQWLWDNLKIAISNIGKVHKDSYKSLGDYFEETNKKTDEILMKIWQGVEDLNEPDLSLLNDLRARKIIDTEGYAKALNVIGANDTYSATKAEYVPSNTQSTSVTYGNMTFNITSDNADEVTRNIVRLLRANGYEISTAMGA